MSIAAPVYAGLDTKIDKLSKGLVDTVKSPLELYDHTKKSIDDADYKAVGLIKGLIEAPFHVIDKAGHGLLDVVTFPVE